MRQAQEPARRHFTLIGRCLRNFVTPQGDQQAGHRGAPGILTGGAVPGLPFASGQAGRLAAANRRIRVASASSTINSK
jgi:hypothetical protein